MIKDELRKLRTLRVTSAMELVAEKNQLQNPKGYKRKKYACMLRVQQLNGYIKIAVFLPKKIIKCISTPKYEIFLNYEGEEYITRVLDDNGKEKRWSASKIENLEGIYIWDCLEAAWINQCGKSTLKKILKTEETGYAGILEWQNRVKRKNNLRRDEERLKKWDAVMDKVPEPPKGFDEWWKKKVISENVIFYKYSRKKKVEGYCTYCEKDVEIIKPKYNEKGKCPSCDRTITFVSVDRMKTCIYSKTYVFCLIQPFEEKVVVRYFRGSKSIKKSNVREQIYTLKELDRYILDKNGMEWYEYTSYKCISERWVKNPLRGYYAWYGMKNVYRGNFSVLSKGALKESGLLTMIRKNKMDVSIEKYLATEIGNPCIEKLVKIGMYDMANEMIRMNYDPTLLNESATELLKMLKLDKARLDRLKTLKTSSSSITLLKWLQKEKEENTRYSDDMVLKMSAGYKNPKDFEFITDRMNYVKIYNYIKKQQMSTKETFAQVIRTWQDYLNMAEKIKMPMNEERIYKPKDLKRAHEEAIIILQAAGIKKQAQEINKKFPKVNEIYSVLQKYEYIGKDYVIVAPKSTEDVVREGTILSHCVHTCDYYFDRMSRQESYLLFLRHKNSPEAPWYTLEVEPNLNIRQKRTTGDNQNKDFNKAVAFLKEWQKEISKKLTKEDIELGKKSEELRKANYAQIRKEKKTVWHGKLAGKLLADVLEADFMAVV